MKTFTTTDTSGHDLVHMIGSKDDYTITENGGSITYTSESWQRTYVVSGNEQLSFKRPDSQGKTNFKWDEEFTPFNVKASCKEWFDSGLTTNGVYKIKPADTEFNTYCDMTNGGWTLVMNNIGNASDLDLEYGSSTNLDVSSHGALKLTDFTNGSRELKWIDASDNVILYVQENGKKFIREAGMTTSSYTNPCPSTDKKYVWTKLYSDAGWSNEHSPGTDSATSPCTSWLDWHSGVYNYTAALDCGSCNHPVGKVFGNGASDYYGHGDVYDMDSLDWNGYAAFNDTKPSFWGNSNTHRLWVK